jgi:DnaJ family protein C protein 7
MQMFGAQMGGMGEGRGGGGFHSFGGGMLGGGRTRGTTRLITL